MTLSSCLRGCGCFCSLFGLLAFGGGLPYGYGWPYCHVRSSKNSFGRMYPLSINLSLRYPITRSFLLGPMRLAFFARDARFGEGRFDFFGMMLSRFEP